MKYKLYLSISIIIVTVVGNTSFFFTFSTSDIIKEIHAQAQEHHVSIAVGASDLLNDKFYIPETIEISSGDTITWINNGSEDHTVTQGTLLQGLFQDQNGFDSGLIGTGQVFEHTFKKPGEFEYHCTIHPHMTGKVIVSKNSI